MRLRTYIRQLRSIRHTRTVIPGPIQSNGALECELPSVFGQIRSSRGPFHTPDELHEFFDERIDIARVLTTEDKASYINYDRSAPFALIHGDINPRNILLGDDGRLWLIDWQWSGFYPAWSEHIAMNNQYENEIRLGSTVDMFWKRMIPFVCGPGFKAFDWYYGMCFTLGYN